MSESFQPGDLVECIGNEHMSAANPLPHLTRGELYLVADLTWSVDGVSGEESFGVDIIGYVDPIWCYDARDFRKIYRPDPKLIERLTAEPVLPDAPPVKKPVREDA